MNLFLYSQKYKTQLISMKNFIFIFLKPLELIKPSKFLSWFFLFPREILYIVFTFYRLKNFNLQL